MTTIEEHNEYRNTKLRDFHAGVSFLCLIFLLGGLISGTDILGFILIMLGCFCGVSSLFSYQSLKYFNNSQDCSCICTSLWGSLGDRTMMYKCMFGDDIEYVNMI